MPKHVGHLWIFAYMHRKEFSQYNYDSETPGQPLSLLFGKQLVSETAASLQPVLFSCSVCIWWGHSFTICQTQCDPKTDLCLISSGNISRYPSQSWWNTAKVPALRKGRQGLQAQARTQNETLSQNQTVKMQQKQNRALVSKCPVQKKRILILCSLWCVSEYPKNPISSSRFKAHLTDHFQKSLM